jgi:hypothetical protein
MIVGYIAPEFMISNLQIQVHDMLNKCLADLVDSYGNWRNSDLHNWIQREVIENNVDPCNTLLNIQIGTLEIFYKVFRFVKTVKCSGLHVSTLFGSNK